MEQEGGREITGEITLFYILSQFDDKTLNQKGLFVANRFADSIVASFQAENQNNDIRIQLEQCKDESKSALEGLLLYLLQRQELGNELFEGPKGEKDKKSLQQWLKSKFPESEAEGEEKTKYKKQISQFVTNQTSLFQQSYKESMSKINHNRIIDTSSLSPRTIESQLVVIADFAMQTVEDHQDHGSSSSAAPRTIESQQLRIADFATAETEEDDEEDIANSISDSKSFNDKNIELFTSQKFSNKDHLQKQLRVEITDDDCIKLPFPPDSIFQTSARNALHACLKISSRGTHCDQISSHGTHCDIRQDTFVGIMTGIFYNTDAFFQEFSNKTNESDTLVLKICTGFLYFDYPQNLILDTFGNLNANAMGLLTTNSFIPSGQVLTIQKNTRFITIGDALENIKKNAQNREKRQKTEDIGKKTLENGHKIVRQITKEVTYRENNTRSTKRKQSKLFFLILCP